VTPYSSRNILTELDTNSESDDNELTWQKVTTRGTERASSSNIKPGTPKRNKTQMNTSPEILTQSNRYTILTNEENTSNDNNLQKQKDPAPPPMFIPGIKNMQPLIIIIEGIARGKNYTVKVVSSDTIKIQTIELEYHKAVIDILKANKAEFHTY
jgi:hypothetical protein